MKITLRFIFAISLISFIACSSNCTLSDKAQARVAASTCFAKIQNIICTMPQAEQDLWAEANSQATSPKCFDCSSINKSSMKSAIKGRAVKMGDLMGNHNKGDRSKLKCLFQTIDSETNSTSQDEGKNVMTTMAMGGVNYGNCTAQFIVEINNELIDRRRILCADQSEMDTMIDNTNSTTGAAVNFAYNTTEAESIVKKFIDFFSCTSSYAASMQNAAANAQDIIANDPKCKASSRLLQATAGSSQNHPQSGGSSQNHPQSGGSSKNPPPSGGSSKNPPPSGGSAKNPPPAGGSAKNPPPSGSNGQGSSHQPRPGSRGIDASTYVSDIESIATAKGTTAYSTLSSKVSTSFNGNSTINCMRGGLPQFLSNINQGSDLVKYFSKGVDCSNDFLVVVTGGQAICEGTCDDGFPITITANSNATNVPTTYYFAAGCASSAKFTYGEFTNPADSSVYTFFNYHNGTDHFDSNVSCGNRSKQCHPPKKGDTSSIPSDCPMAKMNSACKNSIIENCQASGYSSDTSLTQFTLPPACDYVSQGVDITDSAFVQTCLQFIINNFMDNYQLNSGNVQDVTSILADNQSNSTRLLSTSSVSIVSDDPTASYSSYFSTVMLSDSDVSIDANLTSATNQLSASSSAGCLTLSFVLLLVVGLLF